ncbi:MAG: hypothetical protein M3Q10_11410 [Chloroflexota bacterium]|nr:hypothetical protein [Chloroflexota bacterium]
MRRRLDRAEAALHPPQSLAALCAKAAAMHALDTGSVLAEARRILAGAETPREALRVAAAEMARETGRPADELLAEWRKEGEGLIA